MLAGVIEFDGTTRTCDQHPDVPLPDEEAAVRHLAAEHPELWRQATSLDIEQVPAELAPRPNRAARRAAARHGHRR